MASTDHSSNVALVTGAARRVGRSIALALAETGHDIALHHHTSTDAARDTADRIRRLNHRCLTIQADLSDPESWPALIADCTSRLGRLDVLINNAACFDPMRIGDFTPTDWDRTFRLNLTAPAGLAHAAAPELTRRHGCIVNLVDVAATRPWSGYLAYCASKAALTNLTQALAKALAPNVRVNAVAPGIAEFPPDFDDAHRKKILAQVPMNRPGSPQDVAAAVVFLATGARYVTGQTITLDGGWSLNLHA